MEEKILQIAHRLKEARQAKGLKIRQVEELTGLKNGNISCWENGKYLPSALALASLSNIYDVSVDWILKGEGVFHKKDFLKNTFERLIQTNQAWILTEALAELSKNEQIPFAFKLDNMRKNQDDPVLKDMITYLRLIWNGKDKEMQTWLKIQFQKCFPDYQAELQKNSCPFEDSATTGA